jgi:hypothetical protein
MWSDKFFSQIKQDLLLFHAPAPASSSSSNIIKGKIFRVLN